MMTEVDEGRGLVKTTWDKVHDRVAKVEPKFAQLVDEIGPDDSFPLFLAYYPFGETEGDTWQSHLSVARVLENSRG